MNFSKNFESTGSSVCSLKVAKIVQNLSHTMKLTNFKISEPLLSKVGCKTMVKLNRKDFSIYWKFDSTLASKLGNFDKMDKFVDHNFIYLLTL